MSFLDNNGVTHLWEKIKAKFVPLDEDSTINGDITVNGDVGADQLNGNACNAAQINVSGTTSTSIQTSGGITATGNIAAANITGSQTADYTGTYTIGNCTIVTGVVTINVNAANTNKDASVNFGVTFKHTPSISVSMLNIGGNYYQRVSAAGPDTTGFTARVRAGGTPGNVTISWIAIGKLA